MAFSFSIIFFRDINVIFSVVRGVGILPQERPLFVIEKRILRDLLWVKMIFSNGKCGGHVNVESCLIFFKSAGN